MINESDVITHPALLELERLVNENQITPQTSKNLTFKFTDLLKVNSSSELEIGFYSLFMCPSGN